MKKTLINLWDLRKRIYLKAKAEPEWRFWGMYTHICKMETLEEAYRRCRQKKGGPGSDGVTFEEIEKQGTQQYLEVIQEELKSRTYHPQRNLQRRIPKGNGKYRTLSIPTIKDRIVQGVLKLILEPIFEADFQEGNYGSRPKKSAHDAVDKVASGIVKGHTRVIDIDLESYYDNVKHHIILNKVGKRIADDEVMHLLKQIVKTSGKKGIPQGSPISPLLANLYLNDVDKMLEKAISATRTGPYTHLTYARFMDDLVICIDNFGRWNWLFEGVRKRLYEELEKLQLPINMEKSQEIDLGEGESFKFLGFVYRKIITRKKKQGVLYSPDKNKRTGLLKKLRKKMRSYRSQPATKMIKELNPIIRGWVNYFRIGNSARTFQFIKDWIYKKVRRHLMRQRKGKGFGWSRWSRDWIYEKLGLYREYNLN